MTTNVGAEVVNHSSIGFGKQKAGKSDVLSSIKKHFPPDLLNRIDEVIMEKISLKLSEFYQLEAELNGAVNQQTGEKLSNGLLSEKVKLTTKYWLSDLAKKVATEKEAIEKVKNELIQKHGETDEQGNVSIPFYANVPRFMKAKTFEVNDA